MSERQIPISGLKAWEYLTSEHFQKAVETYTTLFMEDKQGPYVHNRGIAYLQMGKATSALEDFKLAAALSGTGLGTSGHFILQGICYWYLNQPSTAIQRWREALTAKYTDAAGGVVPPAILLYAAERLSDEDLKRESLQILRKYWRNHQRRLQRRQLRGGGLTYRDFRYQGLFGWPGAIVPFLLGEIGAEELYMPAVKMDKDRTDRWRSQADFHFALRALHEGDRPSFKDGMTRCAQSELGFLEDEFFLAKWEVENNFPEPAFA